MILIIAQFPPKRRATAMGLFVAGGFGSNIFLSLVGPFLVNSVGWRTLFILLACVGSALIALYWAKGERGPAPIGEHIRLSELGGLLKHPVMWLCGGVQFVRLAVVHSLMFWLPSLLVEERGLSIGAAGAIMAISAALTAPSNFIGGYIADRLGNPATVVATCLAFLAIATAMLAWVPSISLVIAATMVIAIFMQLYFGPLFAIPIHVFGTRTAGLSTGFSNLCANGGAFTLVYVMGVLKDHTGSFASGLYLLSGLCLVGLACSIALGRQGMLVPYTRAHIAADKPDPPARPL
jgi:nitrate/nitrite transporter NarK